MPCTDVIDGLVFSGKRIPAFRCSAWELSNLIVQLLMSHQITLSLEGPSAFGEVTSEAFNLLQQWGFSKDISVLIQ